VSGPFDPRDPDEPTDRPRERDAWAWPDRDLRDPDRYADEDEPTDPGAGWQPGGSDRRAAETSGEAPESEPDTGEPAGEPLAEEPPADEPADAAVVGGPVAREPWSDEPRMGEPAPDDMRGEAADATWSAPGAGGAEAAPVPSLDEGQVSTGWNPRRDGERRRPTTAEQAVPWLIGLILALTGIIIVLVVLIFSDLNGGFGASGSPSPSQVAFASATPAASPSAVLGSASESSTASPSPTPTPAPTYGAEEMLYLSRPSGTGASQLNRDDFSTSAAATSVLKGSSDVQHYAIAPDGTVAVGILGGALQTIQRGKPTRKLASDVSAATFGQDASTVYGVQIIRRGVNDDAIVTAYTFANGKAKALATITHPHPVAPSTTAVVGAQTFDDGGSVRIYATTDGNLVLWIQGAGQWRIDPVSGQDVAVTAQPVLWSPDGTKRIAITQSGNQTTLSLVDASGKPSSSVFVSGLVSHLRWSPRGTSVVFTVGRAVGTGGVVQNIYLWDLVDKKTPRPLSTDGATWGAEFLGARESWTSP
jgi:hypothetical protein